MRILLVSQEYPPETGGGGIGTQTYLKAQGLSARGHDVHVLSCSPDGKARTYLDGAAHVHRMPEPDLGLLEYEPATYWLAYALAVAQEATRLDQERPFDLVQLPEYAGEGFVYQTHGFARRRARYVVQLHGPLAMFVEHMGWPEPESPLAQVGCFMERTVMHHADQLLASSRATARFCAARYGVPLDGIEVVHSGLDTERFAPRPRGADEDGAFPRILFVGNLAGNKGFHLVVDAALRLRARHPRLRLRAIGKGDADEVRRAGERVRAAGAERNVHILGYVPYQELPAQYAWCDLFAGPSTYEPGPGNVYLEAMACGRPVIACDSGGAPEVVLDGETGLLVSPGDGGALERAIAALAEDEALRARLGARGRAIAVERFSLERYTDRIESIYRRVLERAPAGPGAPGGERQP